MLRICSSFIKAWLFIHHRDLGLIHLCLLSHLFFTRPISWWYDLLLFWKLFTPFNPTNRSLVQVLTISYLDYYKLPLEKPSASWHSPTPSITPPRKTLSLHIRLLSCDSPASTLQCFLFCPRILCKRLPSFRGLVPAHLPSLICYPSSFPVPDSSGPKWP